MAFINRDVDGFKIAWSAVNTQWMINVDGERSHTAWRQHIDLNEEGKMVARVHFTSENDIRTVGSLARVVVMEPNGEIKFGVKPKHFNAVMVGRVISEPVRKDTDALGNKGVQYFEQIIEIVGRDRKN
jgi:hypothetical protein